MKRIIPAVLVILAGTHAYAQVQRTFRASITGGGGDGKCTIEVDVDGVAMVEINQDQGRLITLSGQPSEWRRMQCNQRMPSNPNDFRFHGVDGRGRVSLERDPNQNRGVAVIRIEDTQGGRQGYTFDLEWRGGDDRGGNRGGYNNGPGYNNGNNNGPGYGPGYNNGRGYGNDGRGYSNDGRGYNDGGFGNGNNDGGRARGRGRDTYIVSCASNGRRQYCDADTRGGVTLQRQRSDAECRQGSSWGFDKRGIWVDRGCRADFEVGR
jgi:hypothetical protein